MREEEVRRCQIQEWYPRFKSLSIRTLIHELPESFIQYLLQDSGPFLLPLSISGDDALPRRYINNLDSDSDSILPDSVSDPDSESPAAPSFPDLESQIKTSIQTLGGRVFPKLNWSAPKDAAWISTTGTLRCTSFAEIALLLRSSDSAVHDLCHAFDSCSDNSTSRPPKFYLALRKFYPSLRPEMEFRCFVLSRCLIGISQREVTVFYPVLIEKKIGLEFSIREFFEVNLKSEFELEDYVFDVYVMKDGRVKLVDFNPWGGFTLPLMFSWVELEESFRNGGGGGGGGGERSIEFRVVENRCAVLPGLKSAVPYDYLDTSPGSGWDQFLRGADEELRRQAKSPEAGG